MIKITIEKTITEEYKTTKNFITSKTPTDKTEQASGAYSSGVKVLYDEKYEPREVSESRERKVTLLEQEIEKDSDFDFAAVISAVNNLPKPTGGNSA